MRFALVSIALLALTARPLAQTPATDPVTDQLLKAAQPVEDPALKGRIQTLFQKLYPGKGDGAARFVLTTKGSATVTPSGLVLLPRAEAADCQSDDELAGLIAVQIARADLGHWAHLKKELVDPLSTEIKTLELRMSGLGDAGFLLDPEWPDGYEKDAVAAAGAVLIKGQFDPVALLTEVERQVLRAPTHDFALFSNDPLGVRRTYLAGIGRDLRRSAVSTFFAVTSGKAPVFAELMGEPVFKESAGHFRSPDWKAMSGLLDSDSALFRLRADVNRVLDRQTPLFEVVDADAGAVLAELKSSLRSARFRLWKLQKSHADD